MFGEAKIEDTSALQQQAAAAQLAAAAGNSNDHAGHDHSDHDHSSDETAATSADKGKGKEIADGGITDLGDAMPAKNSKQAARDFDEGPEPSTEGMEEKDIELVQSQGNVSRNVAIKALRDNDNDIVNSIMSLSM